MLIDQLLGQLHCLQVQGHRLGLVRRYFSASHLLVQLTFSRSFLIKNILNRRYTSIFLFF